MRYFTLKEILFSAVLFSLFGIVAGIMYFVVFVNKYRVKKIILCGLYVLKSKSFSPGISIRQSKSAKVFEKITETFFEFSFFLVGGIIFIFLLYVGCDGVFRVYTLIITLLFAYLSYVLLNKLFKRIVNSVLDKLFFAVYSILYAFTYPLRRILLIFISRISPIAVKMNCMVKEKRFKRLTIKKSNEQALLFENIY